MIINVAQQMIAINIVIAGIKITVVLNDWDTSATDFKNTKSVFLVEC
jgi:hypothetical protein